VGVSYAVRRRFCRFWFCGSKPENDTGRSSPSSCRVSPGISSLPLPPPVDDVVDPSQPVHATGNRPNHVCLLPRSLCLHTTSSSIGRPNEAADIKGNPWIMLEHRRMADTQQDFICPPPSPGLTKPTAGCCTTQLRSILLDGCRWYRLWCSQQQGIHPHISRPVTIHSPFPPHPPIF
jgi:hypothetical protein